MNLKETYFVLDDYSGNYYCGDASPNGSKKHPSLQYAKLFNNSIEINQFEKMWGIYKYRVYKITLIVDAG